MSSSIMKMPKLPVEVYDKDSVKRSVKMSARGANFFQVTSLLKSNNVPPEDVEAIFYGKPGDEGITVTFRDKKHVEQLREAEVSPDDGLQKGWRSYGSLSGYCTMIGCKTGKVDGYAVLSKSCKVCEDAERYRYSPKSHDCRNKIVVDLQKP